MKRILTYLFLSILLLGAAPRNQLHAQDRNISGRVFLKDSLLVPGAGVTIYARTCGAGAISDEQGNFSLRIPYSCTAENLDLELSLIGYSTANLTVSPVNGDNRLPEPVILDLQPLMLPAAYVTPSGMSPGDFILAQVWDKAEENKSVMSTYNADIKYNITTHEIPVLAQVLSGLEKGAVKFVSGLVGFGPLVRYCMSHNDVSVSVSMGRVVGYGTVRDFNKSLSSKGEELPSNVVSNILNLTDDIDLFGMLYDRGNPWGEKFSKSHKFQLVGTYEYGDKLVDVLYWSDSNNVISVNLHVVEDDWGILRVEMGRDKEVVRFECRDIGEGIYMPVSLTMKPTMSLIRNHELPSVIDYIKSNKYVPKGIKKRSEAILSDYFRTGRDFNPYIVAGFNISYSNIKFY